jgi:seryl-tRNA synthetase
MENKTIRKSATVKVMLSYNYNHFEASIALENENGLTTKDIDDARKDCNRLCDKAIKQYQQSKAIETKRANLTSEKRQLEREVAEIKQKDKALWSVTDKAKVKALEDHNWELQWDYDDDWDEDDY